MQTWKNCVLASRSPKIVYLGISATKCPQIEKCYEVNYPSNFVGRNVCLRHFSVKQIFGPLFYNPKKSCSSITPKNSMQNAVWGFSSSIFRSNSNFGHLYFCIMKLGHSVKYSNQGIFVSYWLLPPRIQSAATSATQSEAPKLLSMILFAAAVIAYQEASRCCCGEIDRKN